MATELFTIGAEAWALVVVAGVGIAVLPWSSVELSAVARAAVAARRLLGVGVSVRVVRADVGYARAVQGR